MPTIFRRFRRDENAGAHEIIAVAAAAITVVSLVSAHLLALMSQSGGLPRIAIISPDGSARVIGATFAALPRPRQAPDAADSRFGAIDYSTTGSLPNGLASSVVLDPCTGRTK